MKAAALKIDPVETGPEADDLPSGTRLLFGQYTIDGFLNSGGFGIVYSARNSLDRRVVIKECFPSSFCRRIDLAVGPRTRAREEEFRSVVQQFLQEARNLARLDHPGIVRVHQVFEENDTAYMAMDLIDGPDLLQTVEGTAAPLTPKEVVAHLLKVLDAVEHVHAQGLLHRDISPDNILLDKATGQPVLIDFGASKKDVTRKSRALSGLRVVKDGYSPQEFYVSGSTQAPYSDLYALGASFYHLITGETPKTSQERLSAIAGGEGDPLRPLAGRFRGYPPAFLQAIDKAMSIFPRDRFQSAAEWREMLAEPAAAPTPAPAPAARPATPVVADIAPAPILMPTEPRPAPAQVAAAPVEAAPVARPRLLPAGFGVRDLILAGTAGALLLSGLLTLPGDLFDRTRPAEAAPVVPAAAAPEALRVTNLLRLPSGLSFEFVDTGKGLETVVSEVPASVTTNLKVGDALLVYTATGEPLSSDTTLRDILVREFANGITTYGFVIRRDGTTLNAEFRLGVAG